MPTFTVLTLPFESADEQLARLAPDLRERIAVDYEHDCWLGTTRTDRDGYCVYRGKMLHRIIWAELVGPIEPGLVLDHWRLDEGLPCSRSCCQPEHLDKITNARNLNKSPRSNASKIRCDHGHLFDAANTYRKPDGHRDCRACGRRRVSAYKDRLQQQAERQLPELRRAA